MAAQHAVQHTFDAHVVCLWDFSVTPDLQGAANHYSVASPMGPSLTVCLYCCEALDRISSNSSLSSSIRTRMMEYLATSAPPQLLL